MKIDLKSLQEDLRKLAITLFVVGLVNYFTDEFKITISAYLVLGGMILWSLGLVRKEDEK